MFKNEKGLTLIELLITIAVIAIVAAISVPVVSNVIAASNTNSLNAMQEQVDQFVAEAAESGTVRLSVDGTRLEALIDQNGDGTDEYLVKTFPFDSKYTVSGTGDGPYTVALGSGSAAPVGTTYTLANGDFSAYSNGPAEVMNGAMPYDQLRLTPSVALDAALASLQVGDTIIINGQTYIVATFYDMSAMGEVTYRNYGSWGANLGLEVNSYTNFSTPVTEITIP